MFSFLFKKERRNRVIVLIDFENLLQNLPVLPLEKFHTINDNFDDLMKKIAREGGEIAGVFFFAPQHIIQAWGETIHKLGFIVTCPKIQSKKGEPVDTTDLTLINFGKMAITNINNLTHLCLGSGDKDFSPLVRDAINKRLKIIVISASEKSLSGELMKLADKIVLFSAVE